MSYRPRILDGLTTTFQRGDGTLAAPALTTAASQAQMETATDNTVTATPLNINWHPGVLKGWAMFTNAAVINASWNVTSVTDGGVGDLTVNWATDFSSANYAVSAIAQRTDNSFVCATIGAAPAAGTTRIITRDENANNKDGDNFYVMAAGDQ